jgi:hypothetical protein
MHLIGHIPDGTDSNEFDIASHLGYQTWVRGYPLAPIRGSGVASVDKTRN